MTTILHVASSSNLHGSVTRQIGDVILQRMQKADPDAVVIGRDLVKTPLPHISPEFVGALFSPPSDNGVMALSDLLVSEIIASDLIILEAPMYNFSIPSALKAWIDHVVRVGKTFEFGADGPQGLLGNKKAIIVAGRGWIYREGPMQALDYQETYLRAILNFMGITSIETIHIEGMTLGPDQAAAALDSARQRAEFILH